MHTTYFNVDHAARATNEEALVAKSMILIPIQPTSSAPQKLSLL